MASFHARAGKPSGASARVTIRHDYEGDTTAEGTVKR
jgi:hypothetical protein